MRYAPSAGRSCSSAALCAPIGPVKFVGEKITLSGKSDGYDSFNESFSAPTPKLNTFGSMQSKETHVVINPREEDLSIWGYGSTKGFMKWEYANYNDSNIAFINDVIATAPIGVSTMQQTPILMRGCDGTATGSGYTPCKHTTTLDVQRTIFPGTSAERKSTAQCTIWVGSETGYSGTPCDTCGSGPGTPFGPGSGGGGQTGGTGSGGNNSGNG